VTERGALTATPARFSVGTFAGEPPADLSPVHAWAGPWLIETRWWSPDSAASGAWFQVVDPAGQAWLLGVESGQWWAEARYD
jgi:protein ImuB